MRHHPAANTPLPSLLFTQKTQELNAQPGVTLPLCHQFWPSLHRKIFSRMKLRGEKNNHCYSHCWTTDARFTKFPQALTQFFKTIQLSFLLIYNLNYNENLLFLTCVKPISSPAAHPETQLLTREQKTESAQVILISKNSANFLLEKPCNSSCHKLIHWEFRRKMPRYNKQTSSFLCNHTSSVHSHLISVPLRAAEFHVLFFK